MPAPDEATRRRLLDDAEADLDGVEAALARLDAGTYAQCEACGAPIGDDRLAADPTTRRCGEHALDRPPVDEELAVEVPAEAVVEVEETDLDGVVDVVEIGAVIEVVEEREIAVEGVVDEGLQPDPIDERGLIAASAADEAAAQAEEPAIAGMVADDVVSTRQATASDDPSPLA